MLIEERLDELVVRFLGVLRDIEEAFEKHLIYQIFFNELVVECHQISFIILVSLDLVHVILLFKLHLHEIHLQYHQFSLFVKPFLVEKLVN